jgi:hypothetical protein
MYLAIHGQAWTGLDRHRQALTGLDRHRQAWTGLDRLRQEWTGLDRPGRAWTGPYGCRRLRLPDFQTVDTLRQYGCQPYAPAAFILQEIFLVLISVRGCNDALVSHIFSTDVFLRVALHHQNM